MTTIGGRAGSRQPVAAHSWAVLAVALVTCLAQARTRPISGVVSVADGGVFAVIRGDDVRVGTRGVTLVAGDIIETGSDALLVIQMQRGTLVGIGPDSGVYLAERGGSLALLMLRGWLKADSRSARAGTLRVLGPHLGIECAQAVVLLHADARQDAIFDEQGPAMLLLHDWGRPDRETRANQFFAGSGRGNVLVQPRPAPDFVAQMPIAFRDALPRQALTPAKPIAPKWLHKVTYFEIQPWLTARPAWRSGFIARFRPRLVDRAFFAAMDAHMRLHPEWFPILHPPDEDDPKGSAGRPPSH